jgi:hypothetical protein
MYVVQKISANSLISLPKLSKSIRLWVALGSFLLLVGVHEFGGRENNVFSFLNMKLIHWLPLMQ